MKADQSKSGTRSMPRPGRTGNGDRRPSPGLTSVIGNAAVGQLLRSATPQRTGGAGGALDESVARAIQQRRGRGTPLPGGVRSEMEGAFGEDFSRVRVHTDSAAHQLNESVSARAFTVGNDIFFAHGSHNPASTGGRRLLAHELTHVLQQSGAGSRAPGSVSGPDDDAERQADAVGEHVHRRLVRGHADQGVDDRIAGGATWNALSTPSAGKGKTAVGGVQRQGSSRQPTVQRYAGGGELRNEDPTPAPAPLGPVSFFTLPRVHIGVMLLNGPAYNARARELISTLDAADDTRGQALSAVDFLHASEEAYGPAAEAAVREFESHARGLGQRRAQQLREDIDRYHEAMGVARAKGKRVAEKQKNVIAAVSGVRIAINDAKQLEAERRAEAAESRVEEARARKKEAQERATENFELVFDTTADLLTGDWTDALKRVAKFAGKEVIELMAGHRFDEEIRRATEELQTARSEVRALEDEQAREKVSQAVTRLQAARDALDAEVEELSALSYQAEAAHEDLYHRLFSMGELGQAAAGAIDQSLALRQEASRAEGLLRRYDELLREAKETAQGLRPHYSMYASSMSGRGTSSHLGEDLRLKLHGRADANRQTCERLVDWTDDELQRTASVSSYVRGGTYLQAYEGGIEDALRDIRMRAGGR